MRHVFEFEMSEGEIREDGSRVIGHIPATGTIVRAEPIWKAGRPVYLVEIDDDPPVSS